MIVQAKASKFNAVLDSMLQQLAHDFDFGFLSSNVLDDTLVATVLSRWVACAASV